MSTLQWSLSVTLFLFRAKTTGGAHTARYDTRCSDGGRASAAKIFHSSLAAGFSASEVVATASSTAAGAWFSHSGSNGWMYLAAGQFQSGGKNRRNANTVRNPCLTSTQRMLVTPCENFIGLLHVIYLHKRHSCSGSRRRSPESQECRRRTFLLRTWARKNATPRERFVVRDLNRQREGFPTVYATMHERR